MGRSKLQGDGPTVATVATVATIAGPGPDVLDEPAPTAAEAAPAGPRRDGRSTTGWDVLGLTVGALVMLVVHRAATKALATGIGHSEVTRQAAIAAALASTVLLAWLIVRDRPRLRDLPRLITGVWTDPPGHWVAGVLGVLLTVPLLSLYSPLLLSDADSARVVAAVGHVRTHGIDYILDTQDNLLPHLLVGPAVAVAGVAGAKAVAVASVQLLGAVVCYVTRRITGSMLGAAAATITLVALPPVADRSGFVPMYAAMLALGYFGAWLAYRAIAEPDHRWARAAAAGVCLALTPEAHAVGQLMLVAPVLLLGFAPGWRTGLAACARIYLVIAAISLPRLALNLSVGGMERVTEYRTDYWITEGYVEEIQTDFWRYRGIHEPLPEYLSLLPRRFVNSLDHQGWIVLGLALLAWVLACRARGRLLVLAATGFMVLAITVKQVPPFPRYYSPLWPGIAMLVGVGVAALVRHRSWAPRALAAVTVVGLVGVAGSTLEATAQKHDDLRASVVERPFDELAAAIDDDRGVIGARSHSLLNVTDRSPTWGGQFLTEDEFVTYLTWPSDQAVIEVMERHDIGWVLIQPKLALEIDYHDTWLIPHHGRPARHVEQVAASTAFCRVAALDGYLLYRLGDCRGGAAPAAGEPAPPG
ncbi:MAG: hypothetical protein ACRD0R_03775 [Acidimicrobiales bacterium]